MNFTTLILQVVLVATLVVAVRHKPIKGKTDIKNVEDQTAEPSKKDSLRHKRGYHHSIPLHVHIVRKPKQKVKKIHIIPLEGNKDHKEEVTHSFEEIHENIEIPEKKFIEEKSYELPSESHDVHELPTVEASHPIEHHKEKVKIKHHHHHHHHNHVKTVVKKVPEPYPVEKIVHVPVEKIVHVPKPYPVEKVVEKVVEVPVEKIVEKVVHVPKPYPVEKIVEKPIHIEKKVPVEIKVPYPVEKIVHVPKPYPVEKIVEKIVHVPKPYPVIKHVPYPVQIKVPVHIPKPFPYPVEKKVPYPVEVEKKIPVPIKVEVEKKVPYPVKVYIPQPAPAYNYEKPAEHKQSFSYDYSKDYHSQGSKVHEVQIPKPVHEDQNGDATKYQGRYASGNNNHPQPVKYQQLLQLQQQYKQQQHQRYQQEQAQYQQQQSTPAHYQQHQQLQQTQNYQDHLHHQQQQNFQPQAQKYVQANVYTQTQPSQSSFTPQRQIQAAESMQHQVKITPTVQEPQITNFRISIPDNVSHQELFALQESQNINPAIANHFQQIPVQLIQLQPFPQQLNNLGYH